jgi:hypothetical protein
LWQISEDLPQCSKTLKSRPLPGQSGRELAACTGVFAAPNDPTATLAVHCGNGFDAGFSPYQSTRLSRYNAVA